MTDQYAALFASYQWLVPSQFNIAQACIHRWAENSHEGRRIALHVEDEAGQGSSWSYQQLSDMAHQLANGLLRMGIQPGDRVAVSMARPAEFIAAVVAALNTGAVAVPLSARMQASARLQCLRNARARIALVDSVTGPELLQSRSRCPDLVQVVGLDFAHDDIIPWRTLLARQPLAFKARPIRADAPALLMYDTSGEGPGHLFAHHTLIGSLPGFVCAQGWFPHAGDTFWTSLDWASTAGLLGGVLPSLYFGRPCVTTQGTRSARHHYETLERYRVTNAHLDIPGLQAMRDAAKSPHTHFKLVLRAIALHAPPAPPTELLQWSKSELGIQPDVLLTLPQAVAVVGQAHAKWPSQNGSVGRPYPGHLATVLDAQGLPCPAGITGELVLNRYDVQGYPDPAAQLGHWQYDGLLPNPPSDWLHTGLAAAIDKQGDIWLVDADPHSEG